MGRAKVISPDMASHLGKFIGKLSILRTRLSNISQSVDLNMAGKILLPCAIFRSVVSISWKDEYGLFFVAILLAKITVFVIVGLFVIVIDRRFYRRAFVPSII